MGTFYSRLAAYYDQMYAHIDYEGAAHRLHEIIQKYKQTPGNRLLDVACGTGTHIMYLNDKYDVMGFDISEEMLRIARKKCPDISFVQGNMVSMDIGQDFDVIICLFGSITYLATRIELQQTIQSFSRHIKPGGVVIIEPLFTEETLRERSMGLNCLNLPDIKIARSNVSRREGNIVYLDFHFLISTREHGTEHFIDPSPMGVFSLGTFQNLMEENGFSVDIIEPGFDKEILILGVKKP
jgi:ubiquinone/menaquinone biosynthesis C-methylase UbiE